MCPCLGGELLFVHEYVGSAEAGAAMIAEKLQDGSAMIKFQAMISAQGVAPKVAEAICAQDYHHLPSAQFVTPIKCHKTGKKIL